MEEERPALAAAELCKDPDPAVRKAAVDVLGRIGQKFREVPDFDLDRVRAKPWIDAMALLTITLHDQPAQSSTVQQGTGMGRRRRDTVHNNGIA